MKELATPPTSWSVGRQVRAHIRLLLMRPAESTRAVIGGRPALCIGGAAVLDVQRGLLHGSGDCALSPR
jgi:hypothetical protein